MAQGDTRQRMVETAARLFQRDGYHATSWRGLVQEAGAPWGSIHHHFPGGKEELGVAAVGLGAEAVAASIDHVVQAAGGDPVEAVRAWFALSAQLMEAGDFATGCPVATVALETAHASPALAEASREAFTRWEAGLACALRAQGVPRRRAQRTGAALLTLLEGALVRARVHRSAEPLEQAGELAADLVRDALDAAQGGRRASE